MRTLSRALVLGFLLIAAAACKSPEVARKDLLRQARLQCEKGMSGACFQAGQLYTEGNDPERGIGFFVKGCAQKHVGSCDALAAYRGERRAQMLTDACNAGDIVSCTRLADELAKDPAGGAAKAHALNEEVCRTGLGAPSPSLSSRDFQGAAFACGKLSRESIATDPARAASLDTLSTMLLTEALFRLEQEEDRAVAAEVAEPPRSKLDRDRAERESSFGRLRHQALLASLDTTAAQPKTSGHGPSTFPLNAVEQAFLGGVPMSSTPAAATDDAGRCRENGDAVSCVVAAQALESKDPAAANDLLVTGCAKKPDGCWALITVAEASLRKKDPARATQLLEKACELKAPNACVRLAVEAELGERGIPQDTAKAAKLLDRACEAGAARACYSAATMADDGRGMGKNPAKAKQYRAKAEAAEAKRRAMQPPTTAGDDEAACRQQHVFERCEAAAAAAQDTDAVKAEELFRLSCTLNSAACGLWGFAVDRFRRDDVTRGSRLLQQGCDEGAPRACLVLAELTHLGYRGVARAEVPAAALYQKACEHDEPHACRVIAARYRSANNTAKADALRDKANTIDASEPAERWALTLAEARSGASSTASPAKARAEWRALVDKARERANARVLHLEGAYAGRRTPPPAPFSAEDLEASKTRCASIKRASESTLPPAPKR